MEFSGFRGEVKLNEPLSRHTSYCIGGPCDVFAAPLDRDDLRTLLAEMGGKGLPYYILGGGTNILVKDGGFRGVIVSLERLTAMEMTREYRSVGGTYVVLRVEAGAPLQRLLTFAADSGFTGLEFAAGIPGTVGGAICMNAGTIDGEIGDIIESITLIAPDGETMTKTKDEVGFKYRTAHIPDGHIIVDATIVLRRGDKTKIRNRVQEIVDRRKQLQPWGQPSAGSVFKNPQDEAAGKLIESSGLKGKKVGNAQVSEQHANFIVNRGDARAEDVLSLMKAVVETVLEATGVRLEPEIKIIGDDA